MKRSVGSALIAAITLRVVHKREDAKLAKICKEILGEP
jgi:hypothetical protein